MSGIVFLGTPHRGSNAASYGRIAYLLTKTFAFQSANTKLLTALEKNSETLDRISTEFFHTLESYKNLRIASFSEEKQIRFGVIGMQIVQSDSAKIGHIRETWGSISEDHRNMAKYASLRDEGFVKVSRKIKEWVDDAQKTMCKLNKLNACDHSSSNRMLISSTLRLDGSSDLRRLERAVIYTYGLSETHQCPRMSEELG